MKSVLHTLILSALIFGCSSDKVMPNISSKYLIVVIIDGPRKTETWDEPYHSFIPFQSELAKDGAFLNNLKNNGSTFTIAGHTSITTGNHQIIDNNGGELPKYPSIFQYWNERYKLQSTKSWIIASKDKLEVLSNCTKSNWANEFRPSVDCGNAGLGSGYRPDSITISKVFEKLTAYEPNLVLVNFREPDFSAHSTDWLGYLDGIVQTDQYVDSLWNFIQNHPHYKDQTTLIVTNDHGRHSQGVSGGFSGHGDNCNGCRSISLLALGPDIRKGIVLENEFDQRDVNATLGYLMRTPQKYSEGKVIDELFK